MKTPAPTAALSEGGEFSVAPDGSLLRAILLPIAFVAMLLAFFGFGLSATTAMLISAPIVLLFLSTPLIARASRQRFDRDLVMLVTTGQGKDAPARYQSALGMRLFDLPARAAERKGRALSAAGRHHDAVEALKLAADALDAKTDAGTLHHALGQAAYAAGRAEAIASLSKALDSLGPLPGLRRKLAHALIREGRTHEARPLLEQELARGEWPELTMLFALADAHEGALSRAHEAVEALSETDGVELEMMRQEFAQIAMH